MEIIRTFLESQPLIALALTIGGGYLLGQVSIRGFALGVGAVLFTGLVIGAIALTVAGASSALGLLMFLYGVGIQYGRQFFAGLAGPGLVWNGLGLAAVLGSMAVALGGAKLLGLSVPTAAGLFAGSGTAPIIGRMERAEVLTAAFINAASGNARRSTPSKVIRPEVGS